MDASHSDQKCELGDLICLFVMACARATCDPIIAQFWRLWCLPACPSACQPQCCLVSRKRIIGTAEACWHMLDVCNFAWMYC